MVGEKSTTTLQAANSEGKPYEESLECELVSEMTGTIASCGVERRGQSQYEISYQPTIKGRHQLHVKVQGQHIRGSPLSLAAKSTVEKLGDPILTIGGVDHPSGVTVNERGELVVAEWGRAQVSVFSPSGEKIQSFGRRGYGQGKLVHPSAVAIDVEGNFLVLDRKVHKFTAEGVFLTAVGTRGNGPLQFSQPSDMAYNAESRMLYVVDKGNNRVQVLNSDLTFSSTFGNFGSGEGQFSSPWGIAFDSTGKVYVVDGQNARVQVFTAEGKFLRTFGRYGQSGGDLYWPNGIAVDENDMLYIGEGGNHRVSVLTAEGRFVTSFGPGELPRGLTVDDNGVVYVCYERCIKAF